ncbi:MAG: pilus assembly protein [Acidimicrobiia bacterium]|nr:pilus assembly protein [Acidimicrobiia bacterium]
MHHKSERGANLVEFALIAPLLIALVLGIVDFAWILSQQQDVRHGAREAARLAAVSTDTGANMATLTCSAMNVSDGAVITFGRTGANAGDTGTVSVVSPVASLTGFSSLPFVGAVYPTSFTEAISFRLEQVATWSNASGGTCP